MKGVKCLDEHILHTLNLLSSIIISRTLAVAAVCMDIVFVIRPTDWLRMLVALKALKGVVEGVKCSEEHIERY